MKARRIGLTHLMGLIVLVSLGLGAMRAASEGMARGVILVSWVALLFATLGAIVRPRGRAGWIGCALFGWGYAVLVIAEYAGPTSLLHLDDLVFEVADRVLPYPPLAVNPFPSEMLSHKESDGTYYRLVDGQHVPFAPDEQKLYADFAADVAAHDALFQARGPATRIGLAFQGVVFAMIGGLAGRMMAGPATTPAEDGRGGGES